MSRSQRWAGFLLPSPRLEAAVLTSFALALTVAAGPVVAVTGGVRALAAAVVVGAVGLACLGTSGSACVALLALPLVGLVRRVTAGPSAYVENDPLVPLAVLLVLPAVIQPLRTVVRRESRWVLALVAWFTLCALWALARGQTVAGGFAFLTAAIPALVAAHAASGRLLGLHRFTLRWLPPLAAACALYGIGQYFFPLPWDLAWLGSVKENLVSVGLPHQGQFRVFGTAESPGVYAVLIGASMVVTILRPLGPGRTTLRVVGRAVMAGLMLFALSLTAVRSVLLALPVGIGVALLLRGRRERLLAVPAIAVLGVTLAVLPTLFSTSNANSSSRYAFESITQDQSFVARADLLPRFASALANPVGSGLGSASASTGTVIDNGYLVRTIETGSLGLLLFVGVVVVCIRPAIRRARSGFRRPADTAWFGTVVFFLVYDISGPLISSSAGLIFWISLSALAAPRPERVEQVTSPVAAGRRHGRAPEGRFLRPSRPPVAGCPAVVPEDDSVLNRVTDLKWNCTDMAGCRSCRRGLGGVASVGRR